MQLKDIAVPSRLWVVFATVLFTVFGTLQDIQGQTTRYTFTLIADTSLPPALQNVTCVGVNNLGTVIASFNGQLWQRREGQPFTLVATISNLGCSSINDLDEIAYVVYDGPATNRSRLVRDSNGILTTLVSNFDVPALDASSQLYLPALTNSGSALYNSSGGPSGSGIGRGFYIAPSGATVYNSFANPNLTVFPPASMNDSLAAVFVASDSNTGKVGIYRGSTVPFIQNGDVVPAGTILIPCCFRPVINNSGTVAFFGGLNGGTNVSTTSDGVSVALVGTGGIDRIAINNAGRVAFRRSDGIYSGRPGSIDEKVIAAGDLIDGSTFQGGFMWEEAINDKGQIAFFALLADGRRGVYRADPVKTPPGPPTGVSGTRGNGQVTVSFTPPLNNGNSPITSYTVTASPGGATAPGSGSPLTVTGLTNGTPYTFTVTATNAIGTSLPSAASAPVTPATTPGAPTDVTGTRGNGQVTVSFTAPNNGGDPITSYTVTASPGGASVSGTASPITVTGLTNGTAYTFTVRATNTVGVGPASAASSPVTPATVPSAPTSVSAIGGNAQATVSFLAPASNGGDAITSYTVTASPGGANVTGTASPITVTGLTNGTSYTFTVRANNSVGSSAASSPSNAITPGIPGTPVNFTVTPSGLSILGTWTPTGGTAMAHTLQVATSAAFSAVIFTVPLGPASFFSLDAPPGTVGTFFLRVIASNSFGTSAPTAIASLTLPGPLTAPSSPVLQNAVVAANSVALNWIPTAGGPPSSYVLLVGSSSGASNVGAFPMGTATSISSSATNGTYFVRVQASNAGGSAISNEVTFTVGTPCVAPAPPTSPSVSRSGNTITVNWGAPATGSSPFTYTIVAGTSAGASNLGSFPIGSATTASSPVPSGTYFLRVRAANACGTSGDSAEVSIVVP